MRRIFWPTRLRHRLWVTVPAILVVVVLGLMWYYDHEPDLFDVRAEAQAHAERHGHRAVTGYVTVSTLMRVASTLLDKPGGFLSNDVTPPAIFMDNTPSWEWGALRQVRDLAHTLRFDISRSQTQSIEDADLAKAHPSFSIDTTSWIFPRAEASYREGIAGLERYLRRLTDPQQPGAQFYARADNLRDWLGMVEKQLGDLSNRLNASVGPQRVNIDLVGDPEAVQSTVLPAELAVKTPWLEIDNVFYEARGACWALIHLLRAAEIDFEQVLEKRNASASLRQIIRDLESSQGPIWSPVILNGSGFGLSANHSLVMAAYIAQANAALIDLRALLTSG